MIVIVHQQLAEMMTVHPVSEDLELVLLAFGAFVHVLDSTEYLAVVGPETVGFGVVESEGFGFGVGLDSFEHFELVLLDLFDFAGY